MAKAIPTHTDPIISGKAPVALLDEVERLKQGMGSIPTPGSKTTFTSAQDAAIRASRRALLVGAPLVAAAAALPAVPGGLHPDAELIAACEEFAVATKERYDLYKVWGIDDVPDELEAPLYERADGASDRFMEMRATTIAGVLARAKALVIYEPKMAVPGNNCGNGFQTDMAAAILRDLLALGGVA